MIIYANYFSYKYMLHLNWDWIKVHVYCRDDQPFLSFWSSWQMATVSWCLTTQDKESIMSTEALVCCFSWSSRVISVALKSFTVNMDCLVQPRGSVYALWKWNLSMEKVNSSTASCSVCDRSLFDADIILYTEYKTFFFSIKDLLN